MLRRTWQYLGPFLSWLLDPRLFGSVAVDPRRKHLKKIRKTLAGLKRIQAEVAGREFAAAIEKLTNVEDQLLNTRVVSSPIIQRVYQVKDGRKRTENLEETQRLFFAAGIIHLISPNENPYRLVHDILGKRERTEQYRRSWKAIHMRARRFSTRLKTNGDHCFHLLRMQYQHFKMFREFRSHESRAVWDMLDHSIAAKDHYRTMTRYARRSSITKFEIKLLERVCIVLGHAVPSAACKTKESHVAKHGKRGVSC